MSVQDEDPTATIIQYMDDILIIAPLAGQVDCLVSSVSQTLEANGFEIADTKIKKEPCVTFLGVQITGSCVTPRQIKIRRNIKTLHNAQRLVGSLQWLCNIVLIPPKIMSPLYPLLQGKQPWEEKSLTPATISLLDFIERQMSSSSRWNPSLPLDL